MSTNTNASSGASQRPLKSEMDVKRVDDEEIKEHIRKYTGNESTVVTADCIIYEVGERNRDDNGAPAGSNVKVGTTGKQTTEELEKGNSVTIIARDASTLNKDTKKKPTDKKKAAEAKAKAEAEAKDEK